MKEHKGIRPQDIVILLKIVALRDKKWMNKDLAEQLQISNSEVSESLNRSSISGLLDDKKREVNREGLLEFIVYGLKYVFPAIPGRLSRGMPTAYSASILSNEFVVDDPYIWPAGGQSKKGVAIPPLYPTVPAAAAKDPLLYNLLALTDALRIGERKEEVVKKLARSVYDVDNM